ncbi:tetratricopeptide repeat protein [Aquamicrobium sp. LC103]|uniref:tetratricopeptide repeat protein n=1 Tax=Aquamicrobium sp. LC103 TaxID=1120658 RepID=UPI00063E92C4|nr:tetratricopeptide repeat protein [Aquamicrobium sp. LC103]TKT76309.1 tetratricopeptide repeat protein [Aquamicrobium sp. LC103]
MRLSVSAGAVASWLAAAGMACAVDTPPSTEVPDLSAIRAQIYSGEYEAAADALLALTGEVRHADLYNLLGFSLRSLARYDEADRWYREALYYDPTHRPAIEYQGELFIAVGNLDGARSNVELLRLLCPQGCTELDTLTRALAEADARQAGRDNPES